MILSLHYKTIFLCLMWKKQLLELFLLLIATSILSVKSSQSFLVQQQRLFSKATGTFSIFNFSIDFFIRNVCIDSSKSNSGIGF